MDSLGLGPVQSWQLTLDLNQASSEASGFRAWRGGVKGFESRA